MSREEKARAGRFAAAFFFAHDLFRPPTERQWEFLHSEQARGIWRGLAQALQLGPRLGLPDSAGLYADEYAVAFGAAPGSGQIPLLESRYAGEKPAEEVRREIRLFHQLFGLQPQAGAEPPDHLRSQLEFAGFLYRMEVRELEGRCRQEILAPLRRAQREYAEQHLLNWLPQAAALAERGATSWVRSLILLALRLAEAAAEPE
jgi:TorA maturation chaperone TorD